MKKALSTNLLAPCDPVDHVLGAADAMVDIVEYGDFECPLCGQAHAALKIVFAHYSPQLRIAFRHFPLREVHPKAELAAEAAEAGAAQGKFWEMHDLLFRNQRRLDRDCLSDYAAHIGLNVHRFDDEMDTHVHLSRVRHQVAVAEGIPVRARPAFFVNGAFTDVSFGLLRLQQAVDEALRVALHQKVPSMDRASRRAPSPKPEAKAKVL
ncbi:MULTISPECIES: thioredoxin domain-containing protein [unclassified Variovorax]|uniref:DsbA family protein n=1 Tax=unclassified Variovorax TaxID=663243 RepID=UPI000838E923|nr:MULTISPECIES: thioredoxin domain-containing protein [unclassified Variovorax]PNG56378.1 hypothetical protein CHC07_02795 [Variovorax sp. B4]PNG57802.1 hypothetical protein CHC06_02798 [Variovorax sp. B2]VTV09759.1 Protein-disulfide isomerase [Variovorax sp. WDL1]